jgi:hypothetical protein
MVNFTIQNIIPNKLLIAKEKEERGFLLRSIFSFFILLILFVIFYMLLIILISDTFQRYRYFIVKAWLIPSLMDAFLNGFYTSFFYNLIISFIVFKFHHLKKTKGFKKILYEFFISSEIHSLFKIRKLVIKHQKVLKEVFDKKYILKEEEQNGI